VKPEYYLLPALAYFYGAVPFGFLLAKHIKRVDLREIGSGNIGATNAARVLGFKFFPLVFLLDFTKGFLPALAGVMLLRGVGELDPPPLAVGAALAAILGHVFPIYLKFKGGKAVAAGTGAFAVLAPRAVLVGIVVWVVVFAIWRHVSLASITAALALGIAVWTLSPDPLGGGVCRTVVGTLAVVLIVSLHHANIGRLLSGTEHKIGKGAKKQDESPAEQ